MERIHPSVIFRKYKKSFKKLGIVLGAARFCGNKKYKGEKDENGLLRVGRRNRNHKSSYKFFNQL